VSKDITYRTTEGHKVWVYKGANGEWFWRRRGNNGEIVGGSTEGYASKADCLTNAHLNAPVVEDGD